MKVLEKAKRRRKKINLDVVGWRHISAFESFGVRIGIRSNEENFIEEIRERLSEILPGGWRETKAADVEHWFSIFRPTPGTNKISFYKDERLLAKQKYEPGKLDFFVSHLRITIAEFAPRHVFLHAGAVGYKNNAIIIPGKSFAGKTTLVSEMIKKGFQYYSDEYAVIDEKGFLKPYAKKLSVRGILDEWSQVDFAAEELGGQVGEKSLPVGLILVAEYQAGAKFKPREISAGEGVIALIANSVSIRQNSRFVLDVLTPVANRAVIIKTKRGEAKTFVERLEKFLESINF